MEENVVMAVWRWSDGADCSDARRTQRESRFGLGQISDKEEETAQEKRLRLAKEYLAQLEVEGEGDLANVSLSGGGSICVMPRPLGPSRFKSQGLGIIDGKYSS